MAKIALASRAYPDYAKKVAAACNLPSIVMEPLPDVDAMARSIIAAPGVTHLLIDGMLQGKPWGKKVAEQTAPMGIETVVIVCSDSIQFSSHSLIATVPSGYIDGTVKLLMEETRPLRIQRRSENSRNHLHQLILEQNAVLRSVEEDEQTVRRLEGLRKVRDGSSLYLELPEPEPPYLGG